MLTRSTASGNFFGVEADGTNATVRLAQSTITANAVGFQTTGGAIILSYGDNYIDNNGSNTGTLGSSSKR